VVSNLIDVTNLKHFALRKVGKGYLKIFIKDI